MFLCSDYGVFVMAFAEHLIHGLAIPSNLNIEEMRCHYAVSLYSYGKRKEVEFIDSEYEHPARLNIKGKKKRVI